MEKLTEVLVCNTLNCKNNKYGNCILNDIEIRDGVCENYNDERRRRLTNYVFPKLL